MHLHCDQREVVQAVNDGTKHYRVSFIVFPNSLIGDFRLFCKDKICLVQFKRLNHYGFSSRCHEKLKDGVDENDGIFLPVLGKQNTHGPIDRASHHVGVYSLFPFPLICSFCFSLIGSLHVFPGFLYVMQVAVLSTFH